MRIATAGAWWGSRGHRISRLVVAVLGAMIALCARTTTAEAHDASFTNPPEISCTGLLTGTVVSWVGLPYDPARPNLQDQSRTNPWITVLYSPDGGDYIRLPQTYDLSPHDSFGFRFSFQLPSPLPHAVKVEAAPGAPWADGAAPGPAILSDLVTIPPLCPPTALVHPHPPVLTHTAIPFFRGLGRYWLPVVAGLAAVVIAAFGGVVIAALAALRRRRPTQLDNANLKAANLRGVHFEKASLRDAHFEKANLRGAHFEKANLRGAHFEEAILVGAHLEGADLTGAQGLTHGQLRGAALDTWAKVPFHLLEDPSRE